MHDALLLAGGKSLRMGKDKAEIELNGRTLMQHALALLEEGNPDNILVCGRHSAYTSVADVIPDAGPPGGVYSALCFLEHIDRLKSQPLIVIPIDMPLLTADLLKGLLDARSTDAAIRYQGEIFPCIINATTALLQHMGKLFSQSTRPGGERSMKSILAYADCREITVPAGARDKFINVNRPEDLDKLGRISHPSS